MKIDVKQDSSTPRKFFSYCQRTITYIHSTGRCLFSPRWVRVSGSIAANGLKTMYNYLFSVFFHRGAEDNGQFALESENCQSFPKGSLENRCQDSNIRFFLIVSVRTHTQSTSVRFRRDG